MYKDNMPCNDMPDISQLMQMPNLPLAQAFVPFQNLNCVYPPMEGLHNGTIFPELNMPYDKSPEHFKV